MNEARFFPPLQLDWEFPLPRTHCGALLGNGVQGLMVWGVENVHLTIGRAGFWDHRGGSEIAFKTTYRELHQLLKAKNRKAIDRIFAVSSDSEGGPQQSTQLGCGRLELIFPDGLRPIAATLDMEKAILTVRLENQEGRACEIEIQQAVDEELAWIFLPPELQGKVSVRMVPAGLLQADFFEKHRIPAPLISHDEGAHSGGWLQSLPEDEPLALAWHDFGDRLAVATALGAEAQFRARKLISLPCAPILKRKETWWRDYWNDVPRIDLPDPILQRAYDYGLYKQAGLTPPQGVAAGLQGPWLEEHQPVPWASDYHFNINVQMIYWPALATNRLQHFEPLWRMIAGWLPLLRQNGEAFFETSDALMLPHAVDDRCHVVGSFWTGTIDHGCTAWMAQMAWLHYRYGMDETILRDLAWPMLRGAFNGYWAMLEEIPGTNELCLPVSVSPEYRGESLDAWGRNASFQLAALHFLAETLPKAASILGEPPDARWKEVQARVPRCAVAGGEHPRIALWEGQDLDESHRHPSHLAGIYPFRIFQPEAEPDATLMKNALHRWASLGMGNWTGWAMAFGALIHARCRNSDAAVAFIHWWNNVFTNEGYGTLHDALFPAAGVRWFQKDRWGEPVENDREIMQMDAGMGMVTAILDLLVQCRGDEVEVLPSLPLRWRRLSFRGVRTEGAFLVGAVVREGKVMSVEVESLAGGDLRLVHHLGEEWTIDGRPGSGRTWSATLVPGQKYHLARLEG